MHGSGSHLSLCHKEPAKDNYGLTTALDVLSWFFMAEESWQSKVLPDLWPGAAPGSTVIPPPAWYPPTTGWSQPVPADLAGPGVRLLPRVLSQPRPPADAAPHVLRALPAWPQGRLQGKPSTTRLIAEWRWSWHRARFIYQSKPTTIIHFRTQCHDQVLSGKPSINYELRLVFLRWEGPSPVKRQRSCIYTYCCIIKMLK